MPVSPPDSFFRQREITADSREVALFAGRLRRGIPRCG